MEYNIYNIQITKYLYYAVFKLGDLSLL